MALMPDWMSNAGGIVSGGGNTQSNAKEFAGLGLALGVVRGVRAFKVDKLGRLTGVHYPQVWAPGENTAECRAKQGNPVFDFDVEAMREALRLPKDAVLREVQVDRGGSFSYSGEVRTTWYMANGERYGHVLTEEAFDMFKMKPAKAGPVKHDLTKCACGFYGYYEGSNDYYKPGYVTAVVEGWGEALIGTRGFRVSKAKIVALYIPVDVDEATAFRVSRNYIEIPQFDSFGAMVTEFEPDGGEHAVSYSNDADDFWTRDV